ncbi:hypothetical protein HMPREF0663_11498 [Hoylesella oralis ATCC 33269]|uniref:Uncharacterized protein n=1 Tax=Hoylesella oralis ATCC 33269 TaxID=873533 RepID=E7RQP7_9BACT|nr:hypothetical protein [Hoylesella oralis]EFZ36585.1 hypothetical protein HMPREF0663_11498 [Hoylesella oralis ATCC 33269]
MPEKRIAFIFLTLEKPLVKLQTIILIVTVYQFLKHSAAAVKYSPAIGRFTVFRRCQHLEGPQTHGAHRLLPYQQENDSTRKVQTAARARTYKKTVLKPQ